MTKHSAPVEPPRTPEFLTHFLSTESAGGLILMGAAFLALIAANTALSHIYFSALQNIWLGMSVQHFVNDGLMAIFFLMVGLEIKRELLVGELSTWEQRILPGVGAIGGMIIPAMIYTALNWGSVGTLKGWAIPTATDIAFALGVLSLLGNRVPSCLKLFLSALAIIDDLGAVTIIALFYTTSLSIPMLLASLVPLSVLIAMNRMNVKRVFPYLLVGAVLWFFVLQSGVHATLAGVAVAISVPMGKPVKDASPLLYLEKKLHGWVAFTIVPLFGFANAGVSLAEISISNFTDPVPLGVALGLLLGKQAGIFLLAALTIRLGFARLPKGSTWLQLYGVSLLCGIGFTMSLFIGNLAFAESVELIEEVKIGVLLGSILAAIGAILVLRRDKVIVAVEV